jgi:NAD(P)-dependent dehydrogenase (short-subunit alcohol dehydrogenase family)
MKRFEHKNVLVTGGASGIGLAICHRLTSEGAKLVFIDRNVETGKTVENELTHLGRLALFVEADLTDENAVEGAFAKVLETLGHVDVLVNNAGGAFSEDYEETTLESWNADLALNLTAHFVLTRLVLPGMVAQGRGVITNVSSVNAIQALGNPAYSAAKAGLISFTQTLAIGYGPKGIRSNAVLPGTVETPVWRHRVEARPEVLELVKSWYPQGRVGQPEDIAAAVAFLSADEAGFVNGTSLTVDGGLTAGSFRMIQDIIGK